MAMPGDDKDDDLYTMDDKSDGEGMVVIEEEPGTVAVAPVPASASRPRVPGAEEDDPEEASDKEDVDDVVGWEDAYEQEI